MSSLVRRDASQHSNSSAVQKPNGDASQSSTVLASKAFYIHFVFVFARNTSVFQLFLSPGLENEQTRLQYRRVAQENMSKKQFCSHESQPNIGFGFTLSFCHVQPLPWAPTCSSRTGWIFRAERHQDWLEPYALVYDSIQNCWG